MFGVLRKSRLSLACVISRLPFHSPRLSQQHVDRESTLWTLHAKPKPPTTLLLARTHIPSPPASPDQALSLASGHFSPLIIAPGAPDTRADDTFDITHYIALRPDIDRYNDMSPRTDKSALKRSRVRIC